MKFCLFADACSLVLCVCVCVQCEAKRSWFNLTAQEIQPLYYHTELEGQGWLSSRGCPEDAWNGGCSLLLDGLIPATRTSPVCAKCVCFLFTFASFSSRGGLTVHAHCCLLYPCVCSVSLRIFSLHVPLASKTLVTLIYKQSTGITVSLEMKTTDASLCTHVDIQDVKREFLTICPLSTVWSLQVTGAYPSYNHFIMIIILKTSFKVLYN